LVTKKIQDLVEKYRQFFADPSPGQILATICPYTFPIPYGPLKDRPLASWDFERDLRAYAEYAHRRLLAFLTYTQGLENDYVPALNPHFGYGVHSAFFTGAEVILGEETSWTHPWLTSWDQLDSLVQDENTPWFRRILACYDYFLHLCDGQYVLSGFGNAGPGDMANAIRGNDLFCDLYDAPGQVHALMDKCADATIWLEGAIQKKIGPVAGGCVTANVWFPGQAPYLSEDFSDLCSAEQYRDFGFAHAEKILRAFGGAYIHHHAKGAHVHPHIARLPGLKMIEQSLDPNCPPPLARIGEIFEENAGVPLMIRCHARDVYRHIQDLKGGRLVIMLNIDTLEEGREVMRLIRKHSIL
jgi:hypothetical protein